jgi:hypothetical protein
MTRIAFAFLLLTGVLLGAHSTEPAGAPPSDVDPAITAVLQKDGVRIKDGDKVLMEWWFVSSAPKAANNAGDNVTITDIPHGALMGVVRFPERGADRRGQPIKSGVYTARLSFFPPDGNHQGVAPQRDFLILSLANADKDPKATPDYNTLMQWSQDASGTPHPLVFSMWKVDAAKFKAGVSQEGEHDQVLQTKVGDIAIAVIVAGVYAH